MLSAKPRAPTTTSSSGDDRVWAPIISGLRSVLRDGEKHLMVAMELMMSVYTPLYAFPQMPLVLEAQLDESEWQDVTTTAELHNVLEGLLQRSAVLEAALAPGHTSEDITLAALGDPVQVSAMFGLRLYDEMDDVVPVTCRQMYESIAALFRAITAVPLGTREAIQQLYYRYQAFPLGYKLPGVVRVSTESQAPLMRFCKELSVEWLQPYVGDQEWFYFPPGGALLAATV